MVLFLVLTVGLVGLWIYSSVAGKEELLVYEFFQLPTVALTELFDNHGEDDGEPDVDELLLQDALEKGQNARIVSCSSEGKMTFLFAGDVLLDDNYAVMSTYKNKGGNIEQAFSYALIQKMNGADVFMVNNEFTFTNRGTPTAGKQFTFRAQPSDISFFTEMGVDMVSVANNHIYDYGEISLLDTLDVLQETNITYVGAGKNLEEAMRPAYLIANGMKIAVVSATQIERNGTPDTKEATAETPGVLRCMDTKHLLATIAEAEENSDFTILYIHWGTESQESIDWLQEEQGKIYAEAGVDLIIGDHPHCLQKIDVVSGVPVIYSLGNFWFNSKTQNSCMIEATFSQKKLESLQFIPCLQSGCYTRLLEGEEADRLIKHMREISPNVIIDEQGYVTYGLK